MVDRLSIEESNQIYLEEMDGEICGGTGFMGNEENWVHCRSLG